MSDKDVWWRVLPVIAVLLLLTGCGIYTEANPLPVRFVNPPDQGPGVAWQCLPLGAAPCQQTPMNYELKRGCNGSWNNWCKTINGDCQCVPVN